LFFAWIVSYDILKRTNLVDQKTFCKISLCSNCIHWFTLCCLYMLLYYSIFINQLYHLKIIILIVFYSFLTSWKIWKYFSDIEWYLILPVITYEIYVKCTMYVFLHNIIPPTQLNLSQTNWTTFYFRIVFVRETRVTGIFAHILIGLSLFLLPYPLSYIPRPVLDGLFLYLGVSALNHNQMFERIMLLVTEQVRLSLWGKLLVQTQIKSSWQLFFEIFDCLEVVYD
jgi:hypothetical protein